jgi:hypothetical protein
MWIKINEKQYGNILLVNLNNSKINNQYKIIFYIQLGSRQYSEELLINAIDSWDEEYNLSIDLFIKNWVSNDNEILMQLVMDIKDCLFPQKD